MSSVPRVRVRAGAPAALVGRIVSSPAARPGAPIAFAVGDCLFLVLVSAQGAFVMHLIGQDGWMFPLGSIAGMAVAMGVQTVLSFAVAPLLGSIESMTPSMVIAMISPMAVDGLGMMGMPLGSSECLIIGGVLGLAMFAYVQVYAVICRKRLQADNRSSPEPR